MRKDFPVEIIAFFIFLHFLLPRYLRKALSVVMSTPYSPSKLLNLRFYFILNLISTCPLMHELLLVPVSYEENTIATKFLPSYLGKLIVS